jgi:hypothetical protein
MSAPIEITFLCRTCDERYTVACESGGTYACPCCGTGDHSVPETLSAELPEGFTVLSVPSREDE